MTDELPSGLSRDALAARIHELADQPGISILEVLADEFPECTFDDVRRAGLLAAIRHNYSRDELRALKRRLFING
jgi:hypothetical protein